MAYLQEVLLYMDHREPASRAALDYLAAHGVATSVVDLSLDPARRAEVEAMGSRRLPTVVVNGVAIEGFDPGRLAEVLGL